VPDPQDQPRSAPAGQEATSLTLLQRLRANEPDAWRTAVQLYTPLVRHWCLRGGVRPADADDVTQEVFLAAASHLADFRRDREGDTFRGWLRGITRHLVLLHFRRAGRQPQAGGGTDAQLRLHEVADPEPAPPDEDPQAEISALHRRALDLVRGEFEPRTWEAFWKTVVEGRSPVAVAAESGVSPAAIRMAKSRVLRRLREEFGDLIQ